MSVIIIRAIVYFSNALIFLIITRAILSWFPEPRSDGIFRQLYCGLLHIAHVLTDPIVSPIRNLIRRSPLGGPGMMLDFSPIIAYFLILFVRNMAIMLVQNIM